ncbi:MAG TPA: hypothetical protein VL326_32625 [Kofleriaceae bacterium]|jgi:hypothetical protein|nr:hypothetical protein [Kofleriaceae bacterium]
MRSALLIGGLVAVLGAAVGIWLLMRGDKADAQSGSYEPHATQVTPAQPAPSAPSVTAGSSDHPALPQPAPGENPRDYVVGDIRVRDHRAGDNAPLDIPPNVHPAEGRSLPSTLTHEVAQKVKAVMMECVANLPKDARGEHPRLEGQVMLAIKANKVTITSSTMQLRNVSGESVEPTKQCIESKTVGIENAAPDQADLDQYPFNISFAIP